MLTHGLSIFSADLLGVTAHCLCGWDTGSQEGASDAMDALAEHIEERLTPVSR